MKPGTELVKAQLTWAGIWNSCKRAFLANRVVDRVRWFFSKRKIRSLERELITRRGFFTGLPSLLLAPFAQLPEGVPDIKQKLISEYIRTSHGRTLLAMSMVQPLRTRRDYTSVGRKTFLVEQLPDSALPFYSKDPES